MFLHFLKYTCSLIPRGMSGWLGAKMSPWTARIHLTQLMVLEAGYFPIFYSRALKAMRGATRYH